VVHSTALNISGNLPSYPTDNHHSSDGVYRRTGWNRHRCVWTTCHVILYTWAIAAAARLIIAICHWIFGAAIDLAITSWGKFSTFGGVYIDPKRCLNKTPRPHQSAAQPTSLQWLKDSGQGRCFTLGVQMTIQTIQSGAIAYCSAYMCDELRRPADVY